MNLTKKIVKQGLMAVLVFGVLFITFAQFSKKAEASENFGTDMTPTTNENIFYDEGKEMYFDTREDGYIDEVYEIRDGKVFREVPITEYIEQPEEDRTNEEIIKQDIKNPLFSARAAAIYSYNETSNEAVRLFGQRASIIQENPGPGSDTLEIGYSASYSHEFTVSVNADIIKVIQAGVSYTYNTTASISSTHTMTIEPGYSGYWRFDPSVRKSMGTLKNLSNNTSQSIRAYYPIKFNNRLDGYLVAVKTPLK